MLSEHILSQIYTNFTFVPTVGQKKLLEKLSEFLAEGDSDEIFIVNGFAGTGKTTVISSVVRTLKKFGIRTVLLAPTGRAAKVLAQSSGENAYTIHKKIYRQKSLSSEQIHFDLDYNKDKNAVYIVDEASMLSNGGGEQTVFGSGRLLDDLTAYVRRGTDCKLILVGDSAQLPPVGMDRSPALDCGYMAAYGRPVTATLDEVMRQNAESGVLFNATLVRCMIEENIIDIPLFRTSFPDVKRLGGNEFLEELADCYDRYGMENVIVITRSNKRANQFNEGIRRHILSREEELSSGDMLMVVKNNYHYAPREGESGLEFIANGDVARLVKIRRFDEEFGFRFADAVLEFPDYDHIEVECKLILDTLQSESPSLTREQNSSLFYRVLEDYSHIPQKKKRMQAMREDSFMNALQIKFSYAVTCHKAQGGQWSCVFVDRMLFGEEEMTRDLLRWLYTAVTRATEKIFFVNFDDAFFEE